VYKRQDLLGVDGISKELAEEIYRVLHWSARSARLRGTEPDRGLFGATAATANANADAHCGRYKTGGTAGDRTSAHDVDHAFAAARPGAQLERGAGAGRASAGRREPGPHLHRPRAWAAAGDPRAPNRAERW